MRATAWALIAVTIAGVVRADEPAAHDVLVYGGTSGGITAAIQVAKQGKSVVIVEPGKHLGGLTSGGLGATDIGNKKAIGGLARDFYRRIRAYYNQPAVWKQETFKQYGARKRGGFDLNEDTMWTFEPRVAERIYREMLEELAVPVIHGERLDLKSGVTKRGNRIVSITMESGRKFTAKMFIDASYEGDLMAKAGVRYHVGREANSVYDETLNGVQLGQKHHQFKVQVDPFVKPGDPASGLLPGVQAGGPGEHGTGDHRVQAYNFRMCLTDAEPNRVPFPQPAGYDPLRYELALRAILAGQWDGLGSPTPMPNRKTDTNNNGAFSSDNIGMNYDYPDGDYATRERIWQEHEQYQQGWCYFLANDPRVPQRIHDQVNQWGLSKDEFVDNHHWPHQLYVREARRMIGALVMTEHHCRGDRTVDDSVGLAAYTMDSHNVQRNVRDGFALNEGDVQVGGFPPYSISYRAIVPQQGECGNLLAPVCLSASHIAYGSIRMEPVFMVLGQSAASAAVQAIESSCDLQQIDYSKLRERLLADQQILDWTGPKPYRGVSAASLPGMVLDDDKAKSVGTWAEGRTVPGYVGSGYLHDENADKGTKRLVFALPIKQSGRYEVRISYTALANRATNVPVTVMADDGEHRYTVNQRQAPEIDGRFHKLGVLPFTAGAPYKLAIETTGTDGHVIVDAVQLLPLP
ncbi:MAG: FAD-dependent oxidoreductase [Planctomycetes bacterium]|nr:FAD-dependent oxidoreductase [Planctomycetota bacterium]